MDSLVFAFNAVAPIIGMVALGYFLKRIGLMPADFSQLANKLVFRVFLPVMLFYNIYRIESLAALDFGYVIYVFCMIIALFCIAGVAAVFFTKKRERRGVLIQGTFRSNYALIGIPLTESLFGAAGVATAAVLSALVVPLLNVLAVIALTVFGGNEKPKFKDVLLKILKNPLIIGCVLGFASLVIRGLLADAGVGFRLSDFPPFDKIMTYLSGMATPLALLVLGARFEFSAISALRREIIFGVFMRTVMAPLLGIGIAYLFFRDIFSGAHFAVFVAVFATPVSVSSAPMTQEMGGDAVLAGQLVVWSTLISAFSIFAAAALLRMAGVF